MDSSQGQQTDLFSGIEMGVGTWAWGDRLFWGFGDGYDESQVEEAFLQGVSNGMTFFDTAEVYGQGKSEIILGRLLKKVDTEIRVASKMMPYPWRIFRGSLRKAFMESLKRLDIPKMDLYQMHWPLKPVQVATWMNQMADLVDEGLLSAVGVSNYDLDQTRRAHESLQKRSLRLASVQLEYSLLERSIENNGIKDYCQQEGIKIIAYSPLAMGVLTGKYTPDNPPRGIRASKYTPELLKKIQPLIRTMIRIGNEHDGKTAGQVALNWVMGKQALPIPGAKNVQQMSQNIGALGWKLDEDEISMLDEMSLELSGGVSAEKSNLSIRTGKK